VNFVERHFGDWARDTAHLTMLEDGAYNRLCDLYYVREAPLPEDFSSCCRLVRAVTKQEREAVRSVLNEFFQLTPEGWRHKRCDAEIERFRAKSGKASASAKARWRKEISASEPDANAPADAVQTDSERNANAYAIASANAERTHANRIENAMPHARARGRAPTSQTPLPIPTEAKLPRERRGTRLPDDWTPGDSGFAFAAQQGLTNGRAQVEADKFRDFWRAKTGADACKADWQATWRNWVRRAAEEQARRSPPRGGDDPFAGAH
jgi:uncharacterized protein YdaU (DUF1376 family)